jgi:hypothetical protein
VGRAPPGRNLSIYAGLRPELDTELLAREMRVAMVCLRAGLRGWAVDPDAAARLEQDLAAEQERLELVLRARGIVNVSTAAGRAAVITALEREGARLQGGSLDRGVLEPLADAGSEVARDVLARRTIAKFRALYARLFLAATERDGRLHACPLTLATVTGRMSLLNVPLQTAPKGELVLAGGNGNVPAAVRGALVADDGNVCGSVDFTAMELRIAAGLSGDQHLRAVVEAGDAHAAAARLLFETGAPTSKQRALAKTIKGSTSTCCCRCMTSTCCSFPADGGYLTPGQEINWWWSFDYFGAVTVTAVPFKMIGVHHTLEVTSVKLETKPDAGKVYLYAHLKNWGPDSANFYWMITSVQQ